MGRAQNVHAPINPPKIPPPRLRRMSRPSRGYICLRGGELLQRQLNFFLSNEFDTFFKKMVITWKYCLKINAIFSIWVQNWSGKHWRFWSRMLILLHAGWILFDPVPCFFLYSTLCPGALFFPSGYSSGFRIMKFLPDICVESNWSQRRWQKITQKETRAFSQWRQLMNQSTQSTHFLQAARGAEFGKPFGLNFGRLLLMLNFRRKEMLPVIWPNFGQIMTPTLFLRQPLR